MVEPTLMLEPLLSPEDIAGLTGMNYHGVLRDIRAGKLKATKKGKGYRIKAEWYDEWLNADIVVPLKRPQNPGTPAPVVHRGPAPAGSVADLDAIEREETQAA